MLLRRLAREQSGFTLVELLSAVLVVSIGVIALLVTFDTSRNLVSFSEAKATSVHLAEQELERLAALPYEDLMLTAAPQDCTPSPCTKPTELPWYVSPVGWYRWDQQPMPSEPTPAPRCVANGASATPITHCEPLVYDDDATRPPAPAVTHERDVVTTPTPSGDARLRLEVQRFVTWADDDCGRSLDGALAPGCVGDRDYKRITVAVRVVGADETARLQRAPKQSLVISEVVRP